MKLSQQFFFVLILVFPSVFAEQTSNITLHPVMDATRNMISYSMPLPASWKIHTPQTTEEPNISGPNGIKVFYRTGATFSFSQDPYMQEAYRASGNPMRPPMTAIQIVQQELIPALKNNGVQFKKQYPLPNVARRNQIYNNKLYKSAPSQSSFDVLGTEWRTQEGTSLFIIVNQFVSFGQGSIFWGYNMQALEAPAGEFSAAKKSLIYGLVNTQDNPQQIQAFNASEQQKANQSWGQHNSRMRQNQQNFDRQQQIHRSTTDAINNSMMSTYRNQNAASDRVQQQTINSIYGEETVTNPYDGQQYQIESGANQTWMNADGEYIQSDDAFYDPNAGYNTGTQSWEEVYPE